MTERALNTLSATEMAEGIAAGRFTSEAVVRACLDRIEEREKAVKAWAFLDRDLALAQARAADAGKLSGPLCGVPFGVKDIIETFDMPTQLGTPIYEGHRSGKDAAAVGLLRAAGAVILGKTVTCEFAGLTPNITTNPLNPAHTPGGSSSGSAAAVADHMVPGAFGTQTGGSIIRPASYCGIIGYKPSYNLICRDGIKLAAESLDTVGHYANTVEDIDLFASVLIGRPRIKAWPKKPPRIGLCRTPFWEEALPESRNAVEHAAQKLWAAGARVVDVDLPPSFDGLKEVRTIVNPLERARSMAYEWRIGREKLSPGLRKTVEDGLAVPFDKYLSALEVMRACRAELGSVFAEVDVLLTPAADGEAEEGLSYTGNYRFQGWWTALHTPAISLPVARGPRGLPIGVQLVANINRDEKLLLAAHYVLERLGRG
jgi:amidase